VTEATAGEMAMAVSDHADGVRVAVRVVPRAPRTALVGRHGRSLKLKVKAPPVGGAANDELCRYLARACGVRPSDVGLVQGERSREKVVAIRGRGVDEVVVALARAGSEGAGR